MEEDPSGAGAWHIHLSAEYKQGLFSEVAGVIALHHVNILSAEMFTRRDTRIADVSMKTGMIENTCPDALRCGLRQDLIDVYNGRLALPYRLHIKLFPSKIRHVQHISGMPHVTVDNGLSKLFTQIQVTAGDSVGLLYRTIRTLEELRLIIRRAEVSTETDRVKDIFYVHDLSGKKVSEGDRIKEIKKALLFQAGLG